MNMEKFTTFYSSLPEKELGNLIALYMKIFSEPPWNEEWKSDEVLRKLQREVVFAEDSFLTIMKGDKQIPLAGFSWGAIIRTESLPERIASSLGVDTDSLLELAEILMRNDAHRVLYFDEFAVDKNFRGRVWPIRFLLLPGLEFGYRNRIDKTVFWTTTESKISMLPTSMGYEPICWKIVRGKEIVFLYNKDFSSLLEIARHINDKNVVSFMRANSILDGKGTSRT